ncbi:MAG TPA: type I DNA topoisomerase [Bacteroidia bacterium]|jgi:DNA topoisomerase-1|nr:type I DNA topoisomerase [Bacteroidia bacterium]
MSKNLVIVESPAKAKTIEGFLGKDFTVRSSFGHVRDLVKKGMGINLEKNFEPEYEISPDKEKVVADLKKLAKGADIVWLATDEDREGEAISWHLAEALGLKISETKRIVFHEITKSAILEAIKNPRKIDKHLVDAQQARRILDRLVGFELSPVLWKKVRPSLSAGRVQSVAVRLIVDREREIQNFKSTSAYRIIAEFTVGNSGLKAELNKRFTNKADAKAFLEKCKGAKFSIGNLETRPAKRSPAAPFTTSTLQQEAARKLSFSVAQTMVLAQRLYEAGKITYMRTDSVNLSETAMGQAKAAINKFYGAKYHNPRHYKTKSKGAQEAHEAIRPTYIETQAVDGERNEQRLYDLIWKRTIASQMADAELEKTTATITISTTTETFVAQGEVLKFDGFLKVYLEGSDDDEESEEESGMLPPMKIGNSLINKNIIATEKFTHHPARYTEASLVKKLEELGIGRPSTYAPTISTIQKRNYVEKTDRLGTQRNYNVLTFNNGNISEVVSVENTGAEKSKMFPTDIGMVVTDFLMQYFSVILDFHFTAKVEEEFDEIADGKLDWTKMLKDFYKPFHKTIESTIDNSERASGERSLGKDPVSGKPIIVRIGRFGPLVQIGESGDENNKPRFASLRKDQRMETITLDEALLLFKMPRIVGEFEGKEMKVGIGRFGPYVVHNNVFTSLGKEDDPYKVDGDRCIELILAKRQKDADKIIVTFKENPDLKVLKGRWGPCIALGKKFFKIPKTVEPSKLDFAGVVQLIGGMDAYEQAIAGNTRQAASKKPSPKKAVAKKEKVPAKAVKKVKTVIVKKAPAKPPPIKKAKKAVKRK